MLTDDTMPSLETTRNIQKVSLIFFVIIGSIHIFSGILLANNYFTLYSYTINRTFDIPFIISALGYGFSSLILHLSYKQKPNFVLATILFIIALIIIASAVYINLFIPDLP